MINKNPVAVIAGIIFGLIPPVSTKLHFSIPYKLIGYKLTIGFIPVDFVWFFIAGVIVALLSRPSKFYSLLLVSIITPILAALFYSFSPSGFSFPSWSAVITNIISFTIFGAIGFFITTKVKQKFNKSAMEAQVL